LDAPIAALIQDARDDNRGFALSVAADLDKAGVKCITHRVEQVLPPADEWEPPVAYRQHTIEDADSLIAFATKYSDKNRGLILYNDQGVVLSLDEMKERGRREVATLRFAYSNEWQAWQKVLTAAPMDHKTLLTHLLLNQHTLQDITILESMRTVKATFTANIDSDLQMNNETVGVMFKATAGNELIRFPREFVVRLPVLDLDVEHENAWVQVPVRVEVHMPNEVQQPVRFQLLAPTLNGVRRTRINGEIRVIQEGLPEWCIVRGSHVQAERGVKGRAES
jgi:hypothetical protein